MPAPRGRPPKNKGAASKAKSVSSSGFSGSISKHSCKYRALRAVRALNLGGSPRLFAESGRGSYKSIGGVVPKKRKRLSGKEGEGA